MSAVRLALTDCHRSVCFEQQGDGARARLQESNCDCAREMPDFDAHALVCACRSGLIAIALLQS